MRVLSVQQPFAQLIVRGVKRLDARRWSTPFRGRIAIHASHAVPSYGVMDSAERDERTARVFAGQGWTSRAALASLPRSAIIGTVELRAVRPVGELLSNAWREPHTEDDGLEITADGGDGRNDTREFVVRAWPDDYLWLFAEPVEIEPVPVRRGQMKLWTLAPDVSRLVAAANEVAPGCALEADGAGTAAASAATAATAPSPAVALDDAAWWGRQWLRDRKMRELARERDRLDEGLGLDRLKRDMWWFEDDRTERIFQRTIERYLRVHPLRPVKGELRVRIVGARLLEIFPDETWVTRVEFERGLRVYVSEMADSTMRPRTPRAVLWDLERALPGWGKVLEVDPELGVNIHYRKDKKKNRRVKIVLPEPEIYIAPRREGEDG